MQPVIPRALIAATIVLAAPLAASAEVLVSSVDSNTNWGTGNTSSLNDPDLSIRSIVQSGSTTVYPRPESSLPARVVFFPPTTPVFGTPIPDTLPQKSPFGRIFPPPEDLADFVNEFFYPALGTRLSEDKFGPKFRDRLEAYVTTRTTLLNELQARLAVLSANDAAARERDLREFAAVQTPRIVAFEKDAERLREDFIHASFIDYNVDWSVNREWHLGDKTIRPGAMRANAEFQVIRAAAYYQKGLTTEQRGLLLEIAIEDGENLSLARSRAPQARHDPLVIFFSPETSRLRLPRQLTPALTASLGAYNHEKDELKRELRDTVVEQDKASAGQRTRAFEALAERQWSRLRSLATHAEEVRQHLAAQPAPPLPPLPPRLPADLTARIEAYKGEKAALEKERAQFLQSLSTMPVSMGTGTYSGMQAMRRAFEQRGQLIQQRMVEFEQANASRYAALKQSLVTIEADLTAFAQIYPDPETRRPMDARTLMRRTNETNQLFDKIGREAAIYPGYRTAMLEPGLSPEQRRLLFGAALVGLAQPLPAGEPLPGAYPRLNF